MSTILFCATHDIALCGKTSDTDNLQDLFKLRIEAGDEVLSQHMEKAVGNAKYTSVMTQNKRISICEDVVHEEIVSEANASCGFSILSDEIDDFFVLEQVIRTTMVLQLCSCDCLTIVSETVIDGTRF